MNNRKARLLLGVPIRSEGNTSMFRVSNRCYAIAVAGMASQICWPRKPSRAQRRFKWQLHGDNFHHPVAEDRAK